MNCLAAIAIQRLHGCSGFVCLLLLWLAVHSCAGVRSCRSGNAGEWYFGFLLSGPIPGATRHQLCCWSPLLLVLPVPRVLCSLVCSSGRPRTLHGVDAHLLQSVHALFLRRLGLAAIHPHSGVFRSPPSVWLDPMRCDVPPRLRC